MQTILADKVKCDSCQKTFIAELAETTCPFCKETKLTVIRANIKISGYMLGKEILP